MANSNRISVIVWAPASSDARSRCISRRAGREQGQRFRQWRDLRPAMSARSTALWSGCHYTSRPKQTWRGRACATFRTGSTMGRRRIAASTRTGFAGGRERGDADGAFARTSRCCVESASTLPSSSPEELRKIDSAVSIDGVAMAAYERQSGYADPIATTKSIGAGGDRRRGAKFHLNTRGEVGARASGPSDRR